MVLTLDSSGTYIGPLWPTNKAPSTGRIQQLAYEHKPQTGCHKTTEATKQYLLMVTFENGENYSNWLEILNIGPIFDLRFKMKKNTICTLAASVAFTNQNRLEIMTETNVTSHNLALLTYVVFSHLVKISPKTKRQNLTRKCTKNCLVARFCLDTLGPTSLPQTIQLYLWEKSGVPRTG